MFHSTRLRQWLTIRARHARNVLNSHSMTHRVEPLANPSKGFRIVEHKAVLVHVELRRKSPKDALISIPLIERQAAIALLGNLRQKVTRDLCWQPSWDRL